MKRLMTVFILLLSVLTSSSLTLSLADNSNPPVIHSIRMLYPEKIYKSGDVVSFLIKYSGGSPGIKNVWLNAYNELSGGAYGECLGAPMIISHNGYYLSSYWSADWDGLPSNYGLSIGPVSASEILMYKYVTDNCLQGVNLMRFVARIQDLTELWSGEFNETQRASLVVSNGLWVPPGEALGSPIYSKFNLDFLVTEIILEKDKTIVLKLPSSTPEGAGLYYEPFPLDVCKILIPFPMFQPRTKEMDLEVKKPGICKLNVRTALARSNMQNVTQSKEIKISSRAQLDAKANADKAAADKATADKAAADKATADAVARAAADKAAADKAAADKAAAAKAALLKKSTITCVKGKLTKKVTAVKPKCPSGYKKK